MTIVGRLTKMPELKYTKAEQAICGFDIASDNGFGDNKKTMFFQCSVWGKMGASCIQHLTKGQSVTIVGELSVEEYNRRDGSNGVALKINVKQVNFGAKPREHMEQENHSSVRTEGNYQGGNQAQRPKDRQIEEIERLASESSRRERETYGDDGGTNDDLPF